MDWKYVYVTFVWSLHTFSPHNVRFKVMEYKQTRYEIALDNNGRQMVEGTKQI